MRGSILFITKKGRELALKIQTAFRGAEVLRFSSQLMESRWRAGEDIVCVMAAGIVVRTIAPLLEDKKTDPAVIVIDEKGKYVISLLSGHLGGANELARKIAAHIGARPVITTASDVQGRVALDVWANEQGLRVEDYGKLKRLSMNIINEERVRLFSTCKINNIPEDIVKVDSAAAADLIVSEKIMRSNALFLRPVNLFAGIGCNRGTSAGEIVDMIQRIFDENNLSINSLNSIASIDVKRDEDGLVKCALGLGLEVQFFPGTVLNEIAEEYGITGSEMVRDATGAVAVAEPAAMAAAKGAAGISEIIIPKIKRGNVTLAIAKAEFML